MKISLYNYWRSSASHRVRIALGLKQIPYDYVAVNLASRDNHGAIYVAKNPLAQVPTLEITNDSGAVHRLFESMAIMEYLDEQFPDPPLLPKDRYLRAHARSLAEMINAGVQPFQNLTTLDRVKAIGGDTTTWVHSFIDRGLAAFSQAVATHAGAFCVGDRPSIADCCLIPQLTSARRLGAELSHYRVLLDIERRCLALPGFANAGPDRQPDAVAS